MTPKPANTNASSTHCITTGLPRTCDLVARKGSEWRSPSTWAAVDSNHQPPRVSGPERCAYDFAEPTSTSATAGVVWYPIVNRMAVSKDVITVGLIES
jgi:hypothetical protein